MAAVFGCSGRSPDYAPVNAARTFVTSVFLALALILAGCGDSAHRSSGGPLTPSKVRKVFERHDLPLDDLLAKKDVPDPYAGFNRSTVTARFVVAKDLPDPASYEDVVVFVNQKAATRAGTALIAQQGSPEKTGFIRTVRNVLIQGFVDTGGKPPPRVRQAMRELSTL